MTDSDKTKKRDFWDIVQILGTALIPAAIALAGFFYSKAQQDATQKNNEIKIQSDIAVANINTSIAQAQLLSTFMESLVSKDTLRQSIAMNAILIGAPVQGKVIVDLLTRSKVTNDGQRQAIDALSGRRTELITSLYSDNAGIRINSANQLINSWLKDSSTIKEMVGFMNTGLQSPFYLKDPGNGLYNCIVVLQNADSRLLSPHKEALQKILQTIPADNVKTITAMKNLVAKIY
ncbi:hypothetical protein ACX0G9_25495 [Flavitalea flava]